MKKKILFFVDTNLHSNNDFLYTLKFNIYIYFLYLFKNITILEILICIRVSSWSQGLSDRDPEAWDYPLTGNP